MKTATQSVSNQQPACIWNLVFCEHSLTDVRVIATFAERPIKKVVYKHIKDTPGFSKEHAKEIVKQGYSFSEQCSHFPRERAGPPTVGSADSERIMLQQVKLSPHC